MKPLPISTTAETAEHLPGRDSQQVCHGRVFLFPEGVPAFEEARQFVFICKPETSPFVFMRSLDVERLGFVCVDPFLIYPDYQPCLSEADTAFLELTTPAEVLLLSIVNPAPDVRQTTANLQGPLAINLRTGRGKQILCDRQDYPVRYGIWQALEQMEEVSGRNATEREPNCSAA